MTNLQTSDLNHINTWLEPGAEAHSSSMSCFQQLPSALMLKQKPLKGLSASAWHYTGLKAGVNEIQGYARRSNS
jgi:hypothetical protein